MLKNKRVTHLSPKEIESLIKTYGDKVFDQSEEKLRLVDGIDPVKARAIF